MKTSINAGFLQLDSRDVIENISLYLARFWSDRSVWQSAAWGKTLKKFNQGLVGWLRKFTFSINIFTSGHVNTKQDIKHKL